MSTEETLPIKEEEMTKNQIHMQLKVLKTNLHELQSNIKKLGLYWLVRPYCILGSSFGAFLYFFSHLKTQ